MVRTVPVAKVLLIFGLALHLHHRFHGSPIGYAGLAAASAASWIGVPGPGEPVLIAAGVLAAKHKLDIVSVLFVAWVGATSGGVGGWLIGMRGGRRVLTTRGPMHRMRLNALARGDDIFHRFTVLAILLTPSWIAGIHRVRSSVYLPVNAIGALLWASGIGLGAYFVGPTIVELASDLGWITGAAVVLLIGSAIAAEFLRRRRHRHRQAAQNP